MESSLISVCGGTDWSQFWPGMIATFVGFLLALLGEFLFEKIKERLDANGLLKRITAELIDIKNDLKQWEPTLIERQPLKTLVWDEAINAGQVSLLKKSSRTLLFKIYKEIQEFNSWSEEQTRFYFEHDGLLSDLIASELFDEKKIMLGEKSETDKIDIPFVLTAISKSM